MTPQGTGKVGLRDQIVIRRVSMLRRFAGHRRRSHTPHVKIDKQELLKVLRTQGDNDTADKVESQLSDEVDTDSDDLSAVGLDRDELMAKLAAAGFGGTIAP
jgi:hypothetical protein